MSGNNAKSKRRDDAREKLKRRIIRMNVPKGYRSMRVDRHAVVLRDLRAEMAADGHPTARKQLKETYKDWGYNPEDGILPPPPRPFLAPRTDRFFAGAPAPTFQAFRRALKLGETGGAFGSPYIRSPENGRRVFVMLAERGIGRGQFFAALGGRDRFEDLCRSLCVHTMPEPRRVHIARLNLGLSHEVLSVFDRISEFISECLREASMPSKGEWYFDARENGFDLLRNDRLQRLDFVLQQAQELGELTPRQVAFPTRMIIAINHANILFESDHRSKNAQAQALFQLLVDQRFDKAPIDFLMLMNEERLPSYFHVDMEDPVRKEPDFLSPEKNFEKIRFVLMQPDNYPEDMKTEMNTRLDRLQLNYVDPNAPPSMLSAKDREFIKNVQGNGFYLHALRRIRPEVFALRFFPRAAMIITRLAVAERLGVNELRVASDRLHSVGGQQNMRWFQYNIRNMFEDRLKEQAGETQRRELPASQDLDYETGRIARIGLVWSVLMDAALTTAKGSKLYRRILQKEESETGKPDETGAFFGMKSGFPYPLIQKAVAVGETILKDPNAPQEYRAFLPPPSGGQHDADMFTVKTIIDTVSDKFKKIQKSLDEKEATKEEQFSKRNKLIRNLSDAVQERFRLLRGMTGHHRFALTVVLAACEDILETERRHRRYNYNDGRLQKTEKKDFARILAGNRLKKDEAPEWFRDSARAYRSDADKGGSRFRVKPDLETFKVCADRVEEFIESIRVRAAGASLEEREDIAIDQALLLYRKLHQTRSRWPFDPALSLIHFRRLKKKGDKALASLKGFTQEQAPDYGRAVEDADGLAVAEAQEQLLLHLALIGQPVEAKTLLACPEIKHSIGEVVASIKKKSKTEIFDKLKSKEEYLINALLDLLVRRCLVFRVKPKEAGFKNYDYTEDRFSVHKSIRRYFYRRFDTPLVDYLDVDQFTVSLYATHPNDLPRPSAQAHRKIEAIIRRLISFESHDKEPRRDRRELMGEIANLRAANGILRSIYSIGVVSRFNTFQDDGAAAPAKGYLEQHRQLIRWMIKRAVRLDDIKLEESDTDIRPLAPLYPEEIAWLYNECGVISLVQGKLNDASDLLRQAKFAVRRLIEPNEIGPLSNRIGLNLAICDIEQGRARDAEPVLRQIINAKEEHQSLRLIALGYLGLIDHLRGNDASARERYERAEQELAAIERFRAASIFARHHADLLRSLGGGHFDEASLHINRAINYAANGAHEDVRHFAQLSKLKIGIAAGKVETAAARSRLESVLDYANKIGVPRLAYEVAGVRVLILMKHGDAIAAKREAFQALKIANRNGLRLRTISSSIQLAQALSRLNEDNEGRVLRRAMRMAAEAEFYSARDSAETMFRSNHR